MKITIESTTKLVQLVVDGRAVEARVWEGFSENGIPVHCFVTRICPSIRAELLGPKELLEFERDLKECREPSADLRVIPLRMIL